MASMSVSGVVSGMDWESMIDTTIEAATKPAQVQVNKRTNLQNKKSLFEEMKVTMNSIQSSLSPLKLPSTYKAKEIEVERIDTNGSYKGVLTATVNADAEVNVYDLEVKQIARAQTNRSKQITGATLKSTLGGIESSKLYINAGNQKIGVDVYGSDSLDSLKSRINTTLKTLNVPVGITASVVDNKLILKSDSTGLGTTSVNGTARQRYDSSGFTSLDTIVTNADAGSYVNIFVDDANAENLKVSSGTSTYTIHKDYEVVNNQIRWKQYEDTGNVKLGESVTASYTMGKGDVYTMTATRGSDDTDSVNFDFDVIDKGTLSQRLKIRGYKTTTTTTTTEDYYSDDIETGTTTEKTTDDDGYDITTKTTISYTTETDEAGNEYKLVKTTVAVTQMEDFVYGKDFTYESGKIKWLEENTNDNEGDEDDTITTNEPSSYTVSYSKDISVDYSVSGSKSNYLNHSIYTDEPDSYSVKITINGTTYYGSVNKTDNDKSLNTIFKMDIDPANYEDLVISNYNSSSYTVNDAGEIEWTEHHDIDLYNTDDDEFEDFDVDELNEAYETATDETLSTLTLTGSDGVLRTYLDPADRSLFKLSDDYGNEYEYGRDYVIRVKDDGDGYVLSWLAARDKTGDDAVDANDANIVVTAYAEAKNISTLNFKASPDADTNFNFTITADKVKDYSASVASDDEDKDLSLESLFEDLELDEGDYAGLVITDSDGKTYSYVESEDELDDDSFTIVDGEIVWHTQTEEASDTDLDTASTPPEDSEYTIIYESFSGIEAAAVNNSDEIQIKLLNDYGKLTASDGATYLSYEQILKDASSRLSASSSQSDVDEALENYFSITDSGGNIYTYGTDFRITMGDEDSESEQHEAVLEWIGSGPASGDTFNISYTGRGEGGGEVLKIDKAVTRSNSDAVLSGTSGAPVYSEFQEGTTTINQGAKTFYEGTDFEIGTNDAGNVLINWKTGTDYEWYFPASNAGSTYTINLTTKDGVSKTYTAARSNEDTLDLRNFGFTNVSNNGYLNSITYGDKTYNLLSTLTNDEGKTDAELVKDNLGINIKDGTNGGVKIFNFDWDSQTRTTREGLPGYGDEVEVEYEYNTNTFSFSDDGDGVVDLLGLNDDITEAQNAVLVLDGEEIERDLNDIGESYGNELIKGLTLNLKGVGEVSMDISHDAEKAVESIQTFVDNYNSLMSWMNTRMTESQVDENTKATVDSDDFRMRWGLLHGNSLLRNTKSQMRDTVAQNFTFSFTSRTSSDEIYGSMAYNGLKTDSTLRLRINSTYVDVPVLMTDTLQDIADKISDSSNPAMRNIYYSNDGTLLESPLIKAKVEGDKLVISSSSSDEISMSGTAAMNVLKMNYTYKGIYQLGIATTSTDYGKSGELEFDTEKFMEALEDNPTEVQDLMLKFASNMDSWTKSMLNVSASGQTSGTLTRQISDLDSQIKNIDEYLEKYQKRLDRMEESLRTRYAAAEQQISKLTQQATAISSILQQLNNGSSNSNASAS